MNRVIEPPLVGLRKTERNPCSFGLLHCSGTRLVLCSSPAALNDSFPLFFLFPPASVDKPVHNMRQLASRTETDCQIAQCLFVGHCASQTWPPIYGGPINRHDKIPTITVDFFNATTRRELDICASKDHSPDRSSYPQLRVVIETIVTRT